MRAIILEDNISYVWDYEMILDKLGVEVTSVHKTWKEVIAEVKKDPPDFMIVDLFLDKNEKGLDFIKEVRNLFIPMIVCTGYPESEFMNEAIGLGVRSFFSKPIDKSALTYELKKLVNEISSEEKANKYLLIKDRGVLVRVPFSKIIKIEIDGNYSYVYTDTGKKFILKISLKKLLTELDDTLFVRCHRSTIINIKFIQSFDMNKNKLGLSNGDKIDLGNKFKSTVKEIFISH